MPQQRATTGTPRSVGAVVAPAKREAEKKAHDAKVEDIDEFLDEIDEVLKGALDENQSAESFIKGFVQKGGQ